MLNKPNFLIVGAAKCGTTSLFEYIRQHPDIYMPACKEVSYFSGRNEENDMSLEEYLTFFSPAMQQKRIGEASGAYLYPKDTPKKIAHTLGTDIKIIMILRNPIEMAHALWGQNKRDGHENLSFFEAVEQENRRLHDNAFKQEIRIWLYQYAYIDRALYAPQVTRYIDTFGRENVKVYIFEKFFKDIEKSLTDLYNFLEVDPEFKIPHYKKYNVAGKVRSKILRRFYSKEHILTDPVRKLVSTPLRRAIIGWLYKINSQPVTRKPLPPDTRAQIHQRFMISIHSLESLIGTNLTTIWK